MAQQSPNDFQKILVKIDVENGYPPVSTEGLWAKKLGKGEYVIDNIPFFAYGLARGDVVLGEERGGALWYVSIVRASGASVFRILASADDEINKIRSELLDIGLPSEIDLMHRLVAVEVPATADIRLALNYLVDGKDADRFDFEEGALRHEIPH